ncbi:TPA: Fis family transcriptional regulator, partial [Clostridioides difficile]|nr:Fis family transcriptional regulator [Clostridioides difficile]HBY3281889.1 Fis family transcriptional regulator [Clostridioides difficile]
KKYGSNTEGMKKVAEALNIGIATLYRKVKKFNIKS